MKESVNNITGQRTRKSIKAPTLLLVCLGYAAIGYTDQVRDASITLGTGYVSDANPRYGNYSGLDSERLYPIIDFSIASKPEWDSGDSSYWYGSGKNLGLESRQLSFTGGTYGAQRFSADYVEIVKSGLIGGKTVFTNKGSTDLRLPSAWVAATSTNGMSGLTSPLPEVDESLKRQRLTLAYQIEPSTKWQLDLSFKHEVKDGNQFKYGIIGNTGGNPRAVALPSPVDYTVNEFQLTSSYSHGDYAFQIGYELGLFENSNNSQQWQNPFRAINGWDSSAGYPSGRGAIALEPDNQYQHLFATGLWRISRQSSLNGSIHYSLMEQDESYLPYSVNQNLTVTTPLPRSSLDGKVDVWRVKLGYQNTLSRRLALRANLHYEDKDNKTPSDLYVYIGGDSQNQDSATSSRARYNLPHSTEQSSADTALRYRLSKSHTLNGTLKHKKTTRDYSEVETMRENTAQLGLQSNLAPALSTYLRIEQSDRDPSRYRGDVPYLASHTSTYVAAQPAGERFENHPLLRKYYLAERQRRQLAMGFNLALDENINIGVGYQRSKDDYDDSVFGLQAARVQSLQIDLSVLVSEDISWGAFASTETYESTMASRSFRGSAIATDSIDSTRNWWHDNEDIAKTLGANINIANFAPNTDFALRYLVSNTESEYDTTTASSLSALPIPQQGDKLIRLSAEFTYHYGANIDVSLGLAHETYDAIDFSYNNVQVNTLNNVITPGNVSPRYSVNEILTSLTYRF